MIGLPLFKSWSKYQPPWFFGSYNGLICCFRWKLWIWTPAAACALNCPSHDVWISCTTYSAGTWSNNCGNAFLFLFLSIFSVSLKLLSECSLAFYRLVHRIHILILMLEWWQLMDLKLWCVTCFFGLFSNHDYLLISCTWQFLTL